TSLKTNIRSPENTVQARAYESSRQRAPAKRQKAVRNSTDSCAWRPPVSGDRLSTIMLNGRLNVGAGGGSDLFVREHTRNEVVYFLDSDRQILNSLGSQWAASLKVFLQSGNNIGHTPGPYPGRSTLDRMEIDGEVVKAGGQLQASEKGGKGRVE